MGSSTRRSAPSGYPPPVKKGLPSTRRLTSPKQSTSKEDSVVREQRPLLTSDDSQTKKDLELALSPIKSGDATKFIDESPQCTPEI